MVKCKDATLDRTFGALADPTRRALLAKLGDNDGVSVSELARPFSVSLPAQRAVAKAQRRHARLQPVQSTAARLRDTEE